MTDEIVPSRRGRHYSNDQKKEWTTRALKLRMAGVRFEDMPELFRAEYGDSPGQKSLYQWTQKALTKQLNENIEEARELERARLDRLLLAADDIIRNASEPTKNRLAAQAQALRVMESRRRLEGMDEQPPEGSPAAVRNAAEAALLEEIAQAHRANAARQRELHDELE